jgi:SpoVK/Ycf46/Vps4 family AAA+-type ATPase
MPLAADVDLTALAERTEGYTGAELAAVCKEAAMAALREDVEKAIDVKAKHFEAAIRGVRPALTLEELAQYEAWPPGRAGRTQAR